MNDQYTKREIDIMIASIHEKLDLILAQTTRHNGRLTRLERISIVVATALVVLMAVNGSSLLQYLNTLIK